jgi:hypothetical protein
MFGDMGYGENGHATATRNQLDRAYDNYDFVYLVGVRAVCACACLVCTWRCPSSLNHDCSVQDIGYADDAFLHTPFSFEYENVYNNYMNWMQNITSQKAFMVLPGNHESECHSPACLLISKYRDALKVLLPPRCDRFHVSLPGLWG